ncbi:MAG: methyltransferase domain-containing protein [Candidatus Krumholzibacteria bacterium]|nr:methyltransferase domain-containing protein [Candidatus Krumholzibacteria bacterium]
MTASEETTLQHLAGGKPASAEQLILTRRMRLLRPFLPSECGHLVDFGCGNGAQTLLLAEACARVTGIDVNPEFLAAFQTEIEARQWQDRVAGVQMVEGRIPLPDGAADVVTSFTVLEHVPDEQAALAEMRRMLKPGGRLLLSVPNRWWIFETHGCDLPLLPWNRVPLVSWWPKKLHDRWARARIYRRREIEKMVSEAGFVVENSFRMTAPMDMIGNASLRKLVRASLFRPDRAIFPFQATENFVVAVRQI